MLDKGTPMTTADQALAPAWTRRLLAAALVGIAIGCLIAVFVPAGLGWDFANYYDAGHKALIGETANLYDEFARIGGDAPQGNMLFMSAPISSYFYVGLALFEPETALVLFKIQNAIALLLMLVVLHQYFLRLAPAKDRAAFTALFFTAALLFQPFWMVFRVGGQVTPTIMLLLALGLWMHTSKRFLISALCFSLIVLMKPVFLPGAIFIALASGPRFLITAVLTGFAFAAFSVAVMGFDIHRVFIEQTREVAGAIWPSHFNRSLTSALAPLTLGCDLDGVCATAGLPPIISTLVRGAGALATVWVYIVSARSGLSERSRLHFAWIIAAILPMMITPVVWAHYLSVIFPAIAFVMATRQHFPPHARALVAAMVIASIGQNLIFVLAMIDLTGMDQVFEKVSMGIFNSLPLWLTLALFVFYRRSFVAAYQSMEFATIENVAPLSGVLGRITADPRVRFIVAGGSLAAFNWLLRFPLGLVLPYESAVTVSAIALAVIGFFLYRGFVFHAEARNLLRQAVAFAGVGIAGVFVTALVSAYARDIFLTASHLEAPDAEAFGHAYGIACAAIVNFLGHRYLTFGRERTA
jgi:putative flippase GtrA